MPGRQAFCVSTDAFDHGDIKRSQAPKDRYRSFIDIGKLRIVEAHEDQQLVHLIEKAKCEEGEAVFLLEGSVYLQAAAIARAAAPIQVLPLAERGYAVNCPEEHATQDMACSEVEYACRSICN